LPRNYATESKSSTRQDKTKHVYLILYVFCNPQPPKQTPPASTPSGKETTTKTMNIKRNLKLRPIEQKQVTPQFEACRVSGLIGVLTRDLIMRVKLNLPILPKYSNLQKMEKIPPAKKIPLRFCFFWY
jgi:hypothetical protein